MTDFELCAEKNILKVIRRVPLTSGSANIYRVKFRFSADWDGMTKRFVFRTGTEPPTTVTPDENDECKIPWEPLVEDGKLLYAGCYGTKGETTVLPTIWACLGQILPGTAPGEPSVLPTPDVWQQLVDKVDESVEALADIQSYSDQAKSDAENASRSAQGAMNSASAAESAKDDAEAARSEALEAEKAAKEHETSAGESRDAAKTFEESARASAENAEESKNVALSSANLAKEAATSAQESLESSAASAEQSQAFRDASAEYATSANNSAKAAANAQTASENASRQAQDSAADADKSASEANKSAVTAKQYSGNPPVIGENGNWQVWDADAQDYSDTQSPARGEPGKSAYEYAHEAGYSGSELQFAEELARVVSILDGNEMMF